MSSKLSVKPRGGDIRDDLFGVTQIYAITQMGGRWVDTTGGDRELSLIRALPRLADEAKVLRILERLVISPLKWTNVLIDEHAYMQDLNDVCLVHRFGNPQKHCLWLITERGARALFQLKAEAAAKAFAGV